MIKYLKQSRLTRSLATVALAVLLPFGLIADDAEDELAQVKQEFIGIKKQLDSVKSEALETDATQRATVDAIEAFKSELLAAAPKKTKSVEAYFETLTQIKSAKKAGDSTKIGELEAEIQKHISKLSKEIAKARKSEAVVNAEKKKSDTIMSEMSVIEPQTQQLIKKQQELYARYQELTKKG